jgi:hypothetical protein
MRFMRNSSALVLVMLSHLISEKSFGRDNRRGEENLIVAVLEDESKCFQKYAFAHNQWEKRLFEGRIRKGGILLSVHCDNSEWTSKAKDILRKRRVTG